MQQELGQLQQEVCEDVHQLPKYPVSS